MYNTQMSSGIPQNIIENILNIPKANKTIPQAPRITEITNVIIKNLFFESFCTFLEYLYSFIFTRLLS